VMRPLAQALDILQSQDKMYMGYLAPTIRILLEKLRKQRNVVTHCKVLVDTLETGILKRFTSIIEDPDVIAAAIVHPKFKNDWSCPEQLLERGTMNKLTIMSAFCFALV